MLMNAMTIRAKQLIISLSIVIGAVVFIAYFSVRATQNPLRAGVVNNLKSMVDEFYAFVEAYPNMEFEIIEKMCNARLTIGKTGFIFVLDSNGNLLIHKKVQGNNWADKPYIKEIIQRKNGHIRYVSPQTHTYKLAAYRYLKDRDWIIVASAFENEFLEEPQSKIVRATIITGVVIVILATVIIFIFAVRITNPLKDITDAAQQIAKGNLDEKITYNSRDEIGQLADAFGEMSVSLKSKADAAAQIAQGNLDVQVEVASETDTLGKAMTEMKDNINALITDVNKLAETIIRLQNKQNQNPQSQNNYMHFLWK